jgi:peptidoglycan/xylan/chitin deacetylase (PgdA/CDA1 family)
MTDDPRPSTRRNAILMYHGVSPQASRRFREFVTSPEQFEEQMSYLAQEGFHVCGVSELIEDRARSTDAIQRTVGLTFDDAFQELLTHAVPLLERLGFGATIYVPTAFIGGTSSWLERSGEGERPLLRAEELRDLPVRGIECGAHSHTHPALDEVDLQSARIEVELSKRVLEETIEREVRTFAYPFGYESAAVRSLVERAGYTSACRVGYAPSPVGEDVYGISRLPVAGACDLKTFAALVDGRASLRGRRALAAAWRPVRRGLHRRQRRPGAAS